MDQLHSGIIIKEEQIEFNSEADEEECFYKESYNILCGNNRDLLGIKDEKSCEGQNTLNDIKNEVGECYNESIQVTDINEKNDVCTLVVKEEFQNEKEEKMSESEKNQNSFIKDEIIDSLHSELIIKDEELISSDTDKVELGSDFACSFLENETTLTGDESLIISNSNESDINESVNNMDVENKNISTKILNNDHSTKNHFMHSNQSGLLHKCDTCEQTFSDKEQLKNHTLMHTREKPFKCDICNRSYRYKTNLKSHIMLHIRKTLHKCDQCEKTFSNQYDLNFHTFLYHGKKRFKCDKCEKSFIREIDFNIHDLTIHGVQTPKYKDLKRQADDTPKYKIDFKIHDLTIHGVQTPNYKDLKRQAAETPKYKCKQSISGNQHLIDHAYYNTGEKGFKCSKCVKSFAHKNQLDSHTLIHIWREESAQ